jgi:hypothetical protein
VLVFSNPDPANSALAAFNMRSAAGPLEVSGLGTDAIVLLSGEAESHNEVVPPS